MPKKDGLQFLKELKDSGNNVPFILFTGKGREDVAINALNLGADRYINKSGKPETVYGELGHSILQVVKKQRSERMLEESERKYRELVENTSEMFCLLGLNGDILFVNKAWKIAMGYSNNEISKLNGFYLIPSENLENVKESWNKILNGKHVENFEVKFKTKNNSYVDVLTDASPIFDEHGKVIQVLTLNRNITEHKKAENALKQSELKYRNLVETSDDVFYQADLQGNLTFMNKMGLEILEVSESEVIDKLWTPNIHPEDVEDAFKAYTKMLKTGEPLTNYECRLVARRGKGRTINVIQNIAILRDRNGNIIGTQGIARDITERKKAEKELERIFDLSPDIVCVCTTDGGLLKVSPSCEKILGYTQEELLKIGWSKLVHPDDVEPTNKEVEKQLNGSVVANFVNRYRHKDGSYVTLEWQASFAEKSIVYATARDITERKKANEALEKSEERYRSLVELSPDGIITLTMKGKVASVNKTFLDLTGFSKDEIVGKNFTKLGTIKASQLPKYLKLFARFIRGKLPQGYEFVYYTKDGSRHVGEAHFSFIKQEGKNVGIQAVLRDITKRMKADEEIRDLAKFPSENPNPVLRVAKDGTVLFANVVAKRVLKKQKSGVGKLVPVIGRQLVSDVLKSGLPKEVEIKLGDKIFSFVFAPIVESGYVNVYGRDVTGRKKVENALNGAFDELTLVNEKLGVVGRLTRHDVRNKLSAVTGNIYLAKQTLPPDSESVKYLKETESAIDQIERIFDFATIYEQLGVEEPSVVDVGKSFDRTVSLLPDLGTIEVVNDCKDCLVLADSLVGQLLYNLMDNSLKHGEKVTKIRLYCKTGKDKLKLVYEDDGVGVSEDEKEKIFGEDYGKNTGLGLHMIKIMCNIYGWTIRETGKHGKGAQFTLTIPKGKYQPLN